jgi:Zn-dependent M28 family amino/carboxypeptidase
MTPEEALRSERSIVIFASDLAKLFGVSTRKFQAIQDKMKNGQDISGTYETKVHMKTSYETYDTLDAKNVIGYIEGTDKKEEVIILTAHYDHLGTYRGQVYNGADDNATGVAALLEIAEAFSIAGENGHQPRRSILFLCPDAEEIGANGSRYYLENPVFPLDRTLVDINIDTIGREDAKRPDLKEFVYVYSSKSLKADLDKARHEAENMISKKPRVEILTTPPGSDNYIFERGGIPSIAYTTGHSKDYHQPTDTAKKIDYNNMHRIVQLVFVTVWEIANQE